MACYGKMEKFCQEMKGKEQMEANQNERERQIERLINFINSNGDSREMKRALAVKLALLCVQSQRKYTKCISRLCK